MYDNYNYPMGTDTPDAPWNQVDPPEVDFDMRVSFTLERDCTITTDDVYNDDGDWVLNDYKAADEAYDYAYAQIPEMLDELVKYIDKELYHLDKFIKARTANQQERKRYDLLKKMKDSASGWEIVERDMEAL